MRPSRARSAGVAATAVAEGATAVAGVGAVAATAAVAAAAAAAGTATRPRGLIRAAQRASEVSEVPGRRAGPRIGEGPFGAADVGGVRRPLRPRGSARTERGPAPVGPLFV